MADKPKILLVGEHGTTEYNGTGDITRALIESGAASAVVGESEVEHALRTGQPLAFRPSPLAAMVGWMGAGLPLFARRRREEKPKRKCRLGGCDILTDHNGGYCCADHCKRDRVKAVPASPMGKKKLTKRQRRQLKEKEEHRAKK